MDPPKAKARGYTWDPKTRIATRQPGFNPTHEEAAAAIEALDDWVGRERKPFALLLNSVQARPVSLDERVAFSRFLSTHRDNVVAAAFGMSPDFQQQVEMGAAANGIRFRAFADEAGARAWLREQGFAA